MRVTFISQPRDVIVGRGSETGSVAIVLMALASRLISSTVVTVISPGVSGLPENETTDAGLRIVRTHRAFRTIHRLVDLLQGLSGFGSPHMASRLYFREYFAEAALFLAEDPPDIVHVQCYPQFVGMLRRAAPKARFVLHLHDVAMLYLDAETVADRLADFDSIVTCSDWLCDRLRERFPGLASRISPVVNGVDPNVFHPRQGHRDEDGAFRLLFVGRVSPEKGIHVLADAFTRLCPRLPEVTLDLVGPVGLFPLSFVRLLLDDPVMRGVAREFYGHNLLCRLDRQILRAGTSYREALYARIPVALRDRIRFMGQWPQEELVSAYQSADVFVMPSICEEPFGIPLVEAMACGLPAVATASGGMEGIVIPDETGLLVSRNDPEMLAKAVLDLATDNDRRRRMGDAARRRATRIYAWDVSATRLLALYSALLGRSEEAFVNTI